MKDRLRHGWRVRVSGRLPASSLSPEVNADSGWGLGGAFWQGGCASTSGFMAILITLSAFNLGCAALEWSRAGVA